MKEKKFLTDEELAVAKAKKAELKKEKLDKQMERLNSIYVFHSRDNNDNSSRVTVVGKYINGELCLSVAKCNPGDAFVRKIGREEALKRLNSGDYFCVLAENNPNRKTFIGAAEAVADAVSKHGINRAVMLVKNSELYSNFWVSSSFFSLKGEPLYLKGDEYTFSYILL